MANNINNNKPVAICDQSKMDVTKCDNHELAGNIEPLIKVIRGQQVMLDKDLATLYGIETKVLNQTVKRNIERFPDDFRFELSREECLRSQFVTSNGRGGNRYSTYAFTEQGVAMLSSVLRSKTAIEVNIQIMRAFVSMRHFMVNNASVFSRLETIEYHQLEMQQHQQETDKLIDEVFRRLDEGNAKPKQGVFYNGQIYDAYSQRWKYLHLMNWWKESIESNQYATLTACVRMVPKSHLCRNEIYFDSIRVNAKSFSFLIPLLPRYYHSIATVLPL